MKPSVCVLLATYNGETWLQEQITSIVNQSDVDVTIYFSDDFSSDKSPEVIGTLAKQYVNIIKVACELKCGSAGHNFYHLIQSVDTEIFDFVAFADQDDIWKPNKLIRHIEIAKSQQADGVSSNVMAFWPDDTKKLIDKAQPQRELDYFFESAGPGCTFLMSQRLVKAIRAQLLDDQSPAKDVALHDWLAYAVCRTSGYKWVIDPEPSVLYRQHQTNVLGANAGFKAKLSRLKKLRTGWYRGEILKVLAVCARIRTTPQIVTITEILKSDSYFKRLGLLSYVPEARRKLADRLALTFVIVFNLL